MTGRLLREPLLHFLLLGLGLFALYAWMNPPGSGSGEHVVVTSGRVGQLADTFGRMHQRAPTADELDELIEDAVREEILYREAIALGLDQDDTIVRRRMRQKLEFVSQDVAPPAEPTAQQLEQFLQDHPDRFRQQASYSFTHVYLDPQRHGDALQAKVGEILSLLARDGSAGEYGDPFLLERRFDGIAAAELSRLFGAKFEQALRDMPVGQWQGPVGSGYGMHLVRIDRLDETGAESLDAVRAQVRAEWLQDQQRLANERYYRDLLARYQVTIERPPAGGGAGAAGTGR